MAEKTKTDINAKFNTAALLDACKKASAIVGSAKLSNMREALKIEVIDRQFVVSSSSLERWIRIRSDLVDVGDEGAICVSASSMVGALSIMNADVTAVNFTGGELVLNGGSIVGLPTLDARKFPELVQSDNTATAEIVMSSEMLADALDRSIPIAADGKGNFNGVYFHAKKTVRIIATNSSTLSLFDTKIKAKDFLAAVPADFAKVILSLCDSGDEVKLTFTENQIRFESGYVFAVSNLLQPRTFDADEMFPTEGGFERLEIATGELSEASISAQRLAESFVEGKPAVKLSLDPKSGVKVSAAGERAQFNRDIPAKYDGDAQVIGVNPKYLSLVLGAAKAESVKLDLCKKGKKPVIVTASDPAWRGLICLMNI